MNRDDIDYWPPHLHPVFAALGKAMNGKRLSPTTLKCIPKGCGSIVADHEVVITHVSAKEAGHKRGHYLIAMSGPVTARWTFRSGELESLARALY